MPGSHRSLSRCSGQACSIGLRSRSRRSSSARRFVASRVVSKDTSLSKTDLKQVAPHIWCWIRHPKGIGQRQRLTGSSVQASASGSWSQCHFTHGVPSFSDSGTENSGARIYGHPDIATRLTTTSGFEAVTGTEIEGLARFHTIGAAARSEQPVEIPSARALAFGDTVVNIGDRKLRLWDAPLDTDKRRRWRNERYLPTLRPLLDLHVDHILVTHGKPVMHDGLPLLQQALAQQPWQRPKPDNAPTLRSRPCPVRIAMPAGGTQIELSAAPELTNDA